MFPTLNLETLATEIKTAIEKDSSNEIGEVIMLSFDEKNNATVIFENGRPKLAETMQDKIKMYLQVLMRTGYEQHPVYSGTKFGMTYFNFRGKKLPPSIITSEVKREIVESLSRISIFDKVEQFEASLTQATLNIKFNLILKDGSALEISL